MTRKYLFADRATAEQAYRDMSEQCTVNALALHLVWNDKQYGHYCSGDYHVTVYGALRADDAIVLVHFAPPGQKTSTSAYWLGTFHTMANDAVRLGCGSDAHELARLSQAADECVHAARRADGWFGGAA